MRQKTALFSALALSLFLCLSIPFTHTGTQSSLDNLPTSLGLKLGNDRIEEVQKALSKSKSLGLADLGPEMRLVDYFAVWLFLALCLVGLCFWAQRRPWVINRAAKPWRKVLSSVLLTVIFWQAWPTCDFLWNSRQVEPDLLALSQKFQVREVGLIRTTSPAPDQSLADKFRQAIKSETSASTKEDAWLEAGAELWGKENWWLDPRFQALVVAAGRQGLWTYDIYFTEDSKACLEAGIRSILALERPEYSFPILDLAPSLTTAQLSQQEWQELLNLLRELVEVQNDRIEQGPDFERAFARDILRALRAEDRHAIYSLNQSWRLFKKEREFFEKLAPLEPGALRIYKNDDPRHRLLSEMSKLQDEGRRCAVLLLVVEVRAKEGLHLDPKTKDLLKPYESWIQYRQLGDGLSIKPGKSDLESYRDIQIQVPFKH